MEILIAILWIVVIGGYVLPMTAGLVLFFNLLSHYRYEKVPWFLAVAMLIPLINIPAFVFTALCYISVK